MALPREETICFNIKYAWHAIFRMYNAQGVAHDLTTSMGFVLLNIDSRNGTPATKIAPLLGMEPRSLSRMLKTLEEKGWIYRKSDEQDKRLVKIFLTESGLAKKDIARKTVKRFNQAIRSALTDEKLYHFFEVIQTVNRVIEGNQIFTDEKRTPPKQDDKYQFKIGEEWNMQH